MRITLYRLNDGTSFDSSVFRKPAEYKEIPTSDIDDVELRLYVKDSFVGAPKWTQQLGAIVTNRDDLSGLRAASGAAVLLATSGGHTFAICFGSGFQAIKPDTYTRGFGVRVTANAIAGTKVKSADTRGLNREGRSQKVVLPVASELGALGIEPSEEWVRQLSGSVTAPDFASTAAGSDSLKLSIKDFSLVDLGKKLTKIEQYWTATTYKTEFGFLDNFVKLDSKDPLVETLDSELTKLVLARDADVFFAEPEPFDRQAAESYLLSYRKKAPFGELEQSQVYDALDELNLPKDDPLRKVTVEAYDADGICVDTSDLYDYIQAELPKDGDRYVLSAGVWFKVSGSYVEHVKSYLAGVEDLTDVLALPSWPKKPGSEDAYVDEGTYNEDVARTREYALLDKKNLILGQYRQIEVCDLLTKQRELICVKRATKSSTLSHLYAQGNVSSNLMCERKYQDHILNAMAGIDGPSSWGASSTWTIVFAIATTKTGPLAESLFFFSQVNLMTTVRDIRSRNINVAVARIDQ